MSRPFYQAMIIMITALLAFGYAAGCNGTHSGNPVDGEPEVRIGDPLKKISKVDILFVMDNSGSMQEEQEAMQRLVEVLVTGDRDGDGDPEFEPADSLHLGVVSTDLGLPEIEMSLDPEGKCHGIGDDGLLQHEGEQPSPCGNGTIEGGEECDGDDLGGETCQSLGEGGGILGCDPLGCYFDASQCYDRERDCGNGVIEAIEQCEGEDLNGETCESRGMGEGTLVCDPDTCRLDVSGCENLCGNGVVDGEEQCDGDDLGGKTCESLNLGDGTLRCIPDTCSFDTASCFLPCGNGTIDDLEECDGDDLGGETCQSLDMGEGTLRCFPLVCTFDTASCYDPSLVPIPPVPPVEETGPVCKESYPLFLDHESDSGDAGQTAEDFTCMLQLGTSGCGLEQPLEAGLKALWPSADDSVTFFGPSALGHGDAENAGFLREDSLLAVIVVSDEDDCSAQDIHIFEHPETAEPEIAEQPPNLRCYHNPDRLYPIERYLDNLKALRPGMEERIIFGLVAGVPPELVNSESDLPTHILGKVEADPAEIDDYYQQILDAPEMEQKIRSDGQNLEPSCTVANPLYNPDDPSSDPYFTKAYPPRRLVEVARGFGVNGVVQSICDESFLSPIETLILAVTNRMIEAEQQAESSEQ